MLFWISVFVILVLVFLLFFHLFIFIFLLVIFLPLCHRHHILHLLHFFFLLILVFFFLLLHQHLLLLLPLLVPLHLHFLFFYLTCFFFFFFFFLSLSVSSLCLFLYPPPPVLFAACKHRSVGYFVMIRPALGVVRNSCPTDRSSGGCHHIWTQTACFPGICVSKDFVHHAPKVFFQGFCQSRPTWLHTCIHGCYTRNIPYQLSALRVSVGIKNRRCKRLATPHANWSTCNFPII